MTDYYDVVLGLIPLSIGSVAAVLVGLGVQLSIAVATGALVSLLFIGHAMFVRAPTGGSSETVARTDTSSSGAGMNTAD